MLKKDWKKNLLRVKQLADQGLGRAEKSEVLSEELLNLEKRVDVIKQVCQNTHKRVGQCLQTNGIDKEKRLRKMPESCLAASMLESAELLGIETLLGQMFQLCGNAINTVANDLLQYELNVENKVLAPIQSLLDNDVPAIYKEKKMLNKSTIDMDVAKSRYQSIIKQNNTGNASAAKTDTIRDEMEESAHRVEQCRDQLSTDMYAFLAKESDYSSILLEMVKSKIQHHQNSLDVLERLVPQMEEQIVHSTHTPVYGDQLDEHLRRSNRDIAVVLEDCICTLLEVGMEEEGLFRVAGSSSKVKKLKAAFDYGIVDMSEHVRDIHCVAGALKLYLRELPEPLMTYELYSEWMHAARQPQIKERLEALWQVLNKLPRNNYNNLRYLIKFLAKLSEKEDINKMSASNIAIVMGPNLIWAPGDGGPNVLNTTIQSALVELLISYADDYFFKEDIDFHKTAHGLASSVEAPSWRSAVPPPLPAAVLSGQATLPRTRPRSTHALNAGFSLANTTLTAPLTPAQQHERSQSVPPFSTLPRTPPRVAAAGAAAAPTQKNTPVVNGATGAGFGTGYPRTSGCGGVGAASPPYSTSSTSAAWRSAEKDDKSASSVSSSDDSVGASSSRRPSLRGSTSGRSSGHSTFINTNSSSAAAGAPGRDNCDTGSLGGDAGGGRAGATAFIHSDSLSEPGSLGGLLSSKRDLTTIARSTTPPPKPPPPKSVHSDVYNTVFALHSLSQSDGWSEYLTTVRGMLDGHMTKRSGSTPSSMANGGAAATADVDFNVTSSSSQGSPVSLPANGANLGLPTQLNTEPAPTLLAAPPPQATKTSATPPGSLSASHDNLLHAGSPSESPLVGLSPRAPRRGTKKPAPLPPGGAPVVPAAPPDKPVIAEKPPLGHSISTISSTSSSSTTSTLGGETSPQVTVTSPTDRGSTSPLIERPQVPPPAPPNRPERPPEKPPMVSAEKPSSPLSERPRPPDRPSMPPPEKPDRPPSYPLAEKPEKPEKPAKPEGGTLPRPSSRPPRPQPPPPPPPAQHPERRPSAEKQAPLAEAEEDGIGISSPDPSPKTTKEETHL